MKRVLFFFVLLLLQLSCSSTPELPLNQSLSHHTADGFTNPYIAEPGKNFFTFLKMRYFSDEPWADHPALAAQVPTESLNLNLIKQPSEFPQVSWLGHSTFLLQYQGVNLLTDPIFSDYASPVSFAGPKRFVPHIVDYTLLPAIDFVVISHNHYDHLDQATVELLGDEVIYFVPLGLKEWFLDVGVKSERVVEMDWWAKHSINQVDIQAMPSQHWSARGLFDRFDSLWASWSVNINGWKVWFAGDTGYNAVQFKEIGERSGGFDLALIPIGAYAPRWFMQTYHVNPAEAVLIHGDVKARQSIGMHWGTFPLTAEEPGEPVVKLKRALDENKIAATEFITLSIGATQTFSN